MIKLIELAKLKVHEKVSRGRLAEVKKMIAAARVFTEPIIVEKKYLIILDGHHRAATLRAMGYKKIPAYIVDYSGQHIKVRSRRSSYHLNKKTIIRRALAGRPYPPKTSMHIIPWRPKIKIRLSKLKS